MKSGTSMATPVVAGAVAVLLSRYSNLKPAEVKLRLYGDECRYRKIQACTGLGRLDVMQLIR